MIRDVLILGGGTAGFIAALALKRRIPQMRVRVLHSADIGVIGVGEGTTALFPKFFFQQLGLKEDFFYRLAEPTWKLGIRFLWGPRAHFHYSFTDTLEGRWHPFPRNCGFYCDEEFANIDAAYALMEHDRAVVRDAQGRPDFQGHAYHAFHVENKKLVAGLEKMAASLGVEISEGTVEQVEKDDRDGVAALVLRDGQRITADLFVDASGFRSELLGRALETPWCTYARSLFCDRAVIGGWPRTSELIKPYTTAETMDAGWCWQIEHETFLNRGYVYSSAHLSDEDALAEFLRKNPQVATTPRVVKFRSGRYETFWRGNVVAIGNASGFVEPLEASAIQVIIIQCRTLLNCLLDSGANPPPSVAALYNQIATTAWDEVRDFLAVHYKFNTRLDTPFWRQCREETELCGAAAVHHFYVENGPSALGKNFNLSPNNPYNLDGYLAMFIGMKVPYEKVHRPSEREWEIWKKAIAERAAIGRAGFTVREALEHIRRPDWSWS